MAEFISVAEARNKSGMRLIVAQGFPGPWAEGIRGIMDVKGISYIRALHELGADHSDIIAWTAQASVPVIAWNDEFPKSNWAEQLALCERIAPTPRLIPEDREDRIRMFGLSYEICGMNGFGWCRRLLGIHGALQVPDLPDANRAMLEAFGAKYGMSDEAVAQATGRVIGILDALRTQLESQQAKGSRYFIGNELSALDIYWAGFSHLIEPMPPDVNPMLDEYRPLYQNFDPEVDKAARPLLMEHRDFIYREHLGVPLDI